MARFEVVEGRTGHEPFTVVATGGSGVVGWFNSREDADAAAAEADEFAPEGWTGYADPFATLAASLATFHLPGHHDQRTHANERRTPPGWREVTDKRKIKFMMTRRAADLMNGPGKGWPQSEDDIDPARYENIGTLAWAERGQVAIEFGTFVHPDRRDELMQQVSDLADTWPAGPVKIFVSPLSTLGSRDAPAHAMTSNVGRIVLSADTGRGYLTADEVSHLMPESETDPSRYTLTHEWGHAYMFSHDGHEAAAARVFDEEAHLSEYGQQDGDEAYAEAFAAWVFSGTAASAEVLSYAEEFGWERD